MIVWALFDSGNGSYFKALKENEKIKIYSIGIDRENKNNHFINLNLSDYSYFFGESKIFDILDSLPRPDAIIASPPCESWSNASAMKQGNACWKKEISENLFESQNELSKFTIRPKEDYENHHLYKYERSFLNRINGELTIYNTIKIIEKYKPKYWVIENPGTSKIFEYIEKIIGFKLPFLNKVYYSNYDYPLKKYTKFASNMNLSLNSTPTKGKGNMKYLRKEFKTYNDRSNIPEKLVNDIFEKILKDYENKK